MPHIAMPYHVFIAARTPPLPLWRLLSCARFLCAQVGLLGLLIGGDGVENI